MVGKYVRQLAIIIALSQIILAAESSYAANGDSVSMAYDDSTMHTEVAWKYQFGDNPEWADLGFEDSNWAYTDLNFGFAGFPLDDWQGICWYRLNIGKDSKYKNTNYLGLALRLIGACEIYLDGSLIQTFGTVSSNPDSEQITEIFLPALIPIYLDSDSGHVVAVRYSNHQHDLVRRMGLSIGINAYVSKHTQAFNRIAGLVRTNTTYQMFFTGLLLAFGLIHLTLFLFYPKWMPNLHFAGAAIFMATLNYFALGTNFAPDIQTQIVYNLLFKLSVIGLSLAGMRLVYSLIDHKPPKQFWYFFGSGVLLALGAKVISVNYVYLWSLMVMIEEVRVVIKAILLKRSGARIMGLGFLAMVIGAGYQMMIGIGIIPNFLNTNIAYLWGFTGLILSMSIHLAREFARINYNLEDRITEVQDLSELNLQRERQAKEQMLHRLKLEEENKRRALEINEAQKLKKVLDDLEVTNHELEKTNIDLRDAQTKLVQSEKMASLGMLVAGIAHEINTPVGAVHSMHDTLVRAINKLKIAAETEDMKDSNRLFGVVSEANEVITSGVSRITNIVRRLRSFARLDEADMKCVNLHEGIDDTLSLVQHELKHRMTVNREYGDIPEIACFPGSLNQVYLNLLMNAAQAIEGEGEITISTEIVDDQVMIHFRDTGCGISAEGLAKIFDPGFTTKGVGVGTGLGLSICYQIIGDHMGEIKVESEVGVGSHFTIILPLRLEVELEDE